MIQNGTPHLRVGRKTLRNHQRSKTEEPPWDGQQ